MSDERATLKPEEVPDFLDKTFAARMTDLAEVDSYEGACDVVKVAAVALKGNYVNWDADEVISETYQWARARMPRAPFAKAS